MFRSLVCEDGPNLQSHSTLHRAGITATHFGNLQPPIASIVFPCVSHSFLATEVDYSGQVCGYSPEVKDRLKTELSLVGHSEWQGIIVDHCLASQSAEFSSIDTSPPF